MKTFYITFAGGSIFGKYYIAVMAIDEDKVREFCQAHVPGWGSVYSEERFAGQAERYRLQPLPIESDKFLYCQIEHVQPRDGAGAA